MSDLTDLACDLIRRASVTPEDAGCQDFIGERLAAAGFSLESMSASEVTNLWARRGKETPLLCFAGHTDVVPPGPLEHWRRAPFSPVIEQDTLFGRGAADMKGSLAAMVIAIERFVAEHPRHSGSIAVLLTSDEEGPAINGTRAVMEMLQDRGERLDYCVVGEPSARERSGDRVRIGRRGSLNARLEVRGLQGHVAYPDEAANPIHEALPVLAELSRCKWDEGTDDFPPTGLQFTNINAGVGASNVTPATLAVDFNLRFSPACTAKEIEARLRAMLDAACADYALECVVSGEPFYTAPGTLRTAVRAATEAICGEAAEESTGGGTSDGRFIAPTGTEVVELGPPGKTLHKVDERVAVAELERLADIYVTLMRSLLC